MLDLSLENRALAESRLNTEEVIWFTTVTNKGVPQPNPVWFCWDGQEVILYSKPGSYRMRNLRQNSNVALNLQGAGVLGEDVLVITGCAVINSHYLAPHPLFRQKYAQYLNAMGVTAEELAADYSIEIRVKPLKVRGM